MITQSINLNLIPGGVLPRINVSQYDDDSRTLSLNLYNGNVAYSVPAGSSVYIVGTKKDNTGFEYACTFSGSTVSVDITDQMTAFAGEVVCELRINKNGATLGTSNFILNVEPTALRDDTVISETDIPIIQQIPQYVQDCADKATLAESWAVGGTGTRTGEDTNNAEYWANQSQAYAIGAFHWKASVAFASIPTTGLTNGDVYNITDDFTTDSRFVEGSGIKCAAGSNIVWNGSKWDILTPATTASQVKFDGTSSGSTETNVQGELDYLEAEATTTYGTCSTAAATATKVVTISNTHWRLRVGSEVVVKFTNTNTAQNPKLNVNGTGAKSIWFNTGVLTTSTLDRGGYANRPMRYVYDGTYWIWMGWSNDNNTTTGTTYTPENLPSNTTYATQGSVKNVYNALSNDITTINSNLTANIFNSPVSLAADNSYTTPCDGYVELSFGGGSNLKGYVSVKDTNNRGFSFGTNNSGNTYEARALFVKKGFVLKLSNGATASATFYPLNY